MSKRIEQTQDAFITMMGYWSEELQVGPIVLVVDNKIKDLMAYVSKHRGIQYCYFSPKDLSSLTQAEFVATVFHELAHLKKDVFWETVGKEEAEYQAEKQALIWLKKYANRYYDEYVKLMREALKSSAYTGRHKEYQKAFERIKEYQQ